MTALPYVRLRAERLEAWLPERGTSKVQCQNPGVQPVTNDSLPTANGDTFLHGCGQSVFVSPLAVRVWGVWANVPLFVLNMKHELP
jgi:hypothetical protein